MDFFTQKRYLITLIIVLLILNGGTLFLLWMGKQRAPAPPSDSGRDDREQFKVEKLLREELAFTPEQIERYLQLRRDHREQIRRLNNEIRRIKDEMFDAVLGNAPRPELSDSLLALTQQKQAEIERLTFQHFLNLKELCKPGQRDKLKLLIRELYHGRPAGKRGNSPQSPAEDRRPDGPPPAER